MEQLPVEEDALNAGDGGNNASSSSGGASSSSSSGGSDKDADARRDGGSDGGDDDDDDGGNVLDGSTDSGLPNCATSADPRCDPRTLFVRARVSTGNDPTPDGTFTNPYASITAALAHAKANGSIKRIWIAAGDYRETPTFLSNIEYKGGFLCQKDPCDWAPRDVGTRIYATTPEGTVMESLSASTIFDGLEFYALQANLPVTPSLIRTVTLRDSAAVLRDVNINGTPVGIATKTVALTILGSTGAGPRLQTVSIDGRSTATHASVGLEIDRSATSDPKLTMIGGGVAAGQADLSVAVHVLAGTSRTILLEALHEITAGPSAPIAPSTGEAASWGVYVRDHAGLEIRQSKVNNPTDIIADGPSRKRAYCATGPNFCGGIRSDRGDLLVRSSWIGGLPAALSTAIMLVDQPTNGLNAVINGNTLDGGGGQFVTSATERKSAAVVVKSVNNTMKAGRVRNNLLGSGANTMRFNVYEDGTTTRQAHLEKVENNAFYFRDGQANAWAYHTSSGANVLYGDIAGNASVDPQPVDCVAATPVFRIVTGHPPVFLAFDVMKANDSPILGGGLFDGEAFARDYNGGPRTRAPGNTMDIGADQADP